MLTYQTKACARLTLSGTSFVLDNSTVHNLLQLPILSSNSREYSELKNKVWVAVVVESNVTWSTLTLMSALRGHQLFLTCTFIPDRYFSHPKTQCWSHLTRLLAEQHHCLCDKLVYYYFTTWCESNIDSLFSCVCSQPPRRLSGTFAAQPSAALTIQVNNRVSLLFWCRTVGFSKLSHWKHLLQLKTTKWKQREWIKTLMLQAGWLNNALHCLEYAGSSLSQDWEGVKKSMGYITHWIPSVFPLLHLEEMNLAKQNSQTQ